MLNRLFISIVVVSTVMVSNSTVCFSANIPNSLNVGGNELSLNGVGARKKNFLQLYVAGLYLTQRTNQAASVIASDTPMAIRIEITSGFVSQAKMVAALNQGFQKSSRGNTSSIQNEINAFRQCFSDKITKGDVFDIVYLPSSGVLVAKNGQRKNVIKGLAFKQALFGIWLSDQPADVNLKKALLGN